MTSSGPRVAGNLFGIDLAGLFRDDEERGGILNLNPFLQLTNTGKGRGGVLSFRPQQQTGTTATLGLGGGGGLQNINVVGSNVGANTGVIEGDVGVGQALDTDTETETPDPGPQLPQRFTPDEGGVRYQTDYLKNLTQQEATGKANQLLNRALGDQLNQGLYNKLFEPLYKDLQEGNDYGLDIDRFYKAVRKEGYEPYAGQTNFGVLGTEGKEGGYDSYAKLVEGRFAAGKENAEFFDPADAGRRFLEAKAFYRPGGDKTNLTAIGNIQNRFDAGEMKFKGFGGNPYEGGYRSADLSGPTKDFYENYLKGVTGDVGTPSDPRPEATQLGEFADYDFASQGGPGFGMKDVEELLGRGASTAQLRSLIGKARDQGLNIGERAETLTQQNTGSPDQSRFQDFDFGAYGQSGFGMKDVQAALDQGANRREIRMLGDRARKQGLNVGPRVKELFGGF